MKEIVSAFEDKIYGNNQKKESDQMIRFDLCMKRNYRKKGENDERDYLLKHLELHKRKRPAISDEADSVGRNLTAIFKKRYAPTEHNDAK